MESMSTGPAWKTDKGTLIRVLVRPGSRDPDFVSEISEDTIHINLKGPARDGKANTELVKRLAKTLNLSTSSLFLVAGHKSREKTLLIVEMEPAEVLERLAGIV